jgi:hypothetical protein
MGLGDLAMQLTFVILQHLFGKGKSRSEARIGTGERALS